MRQKGVIEFEVEDELRKATKNREIKGKHPEAPQVRRQRRRQRRLVAGGVGGCEWIAWPLALKAEITEVPLGEQKEAQEGEAISKVKTDALERQADVVEVPLVAKVPQASALRTAEIQDGGAERADAQ